MAIERSVRINVQTGNAKAELNGLAKSLRDTDKSSEELSKALNGTEKEFDDLASAAGSARKQSDSAKTGFDGLSNSSRKTGGNFKAMKGATTQLGFQLQDIAVQAQAGTSAFVILGQQGPQIASIFGPGGAVVGAVVAVAAAIGGTLATSIMNTGEEIDNLASVAERIRLRTKQWNDEIKEFDTSELQLGVRQSEERIQELEDAIERAQGQLDGFGVNANILGGGADRVATLKNRIEDLRDQIAEEEGQRASLQGQIELNNQARQRENELTSKNNISDLVSALKDQAETLGFSARQTALYRLEKEAANVTDKSVIDTAREEINARFDSIEAYKAEQEAIKEREQAAKKAQADAERRIQQQLRQAENQREANVNLVNTLENQLVVALAATDREAAILTATQRLNTLATNEQRDAVAQLAGQLYDLRNAGQTYDELKAKLDPLAALTASYLSVVKDVSDADLTATQERELLTIATERYADALSEAQRQQELNKETEQSYFGAFSQGLRDSLLTAESSYDQIREVGRNAIEDLSASIANFVATGEGDFRSFASSVIAELLRVQTQLLITQSLSGTSIGSLFGIGASRGAVVTGTTAARGAVVDGEKYANGGVPSLSQFSNSVVSTPTQFAAGGKTNQMGEAGAEAILPLQRTAGGELGVRADGGQSPTVNVAPPEVNVRVVNVTENPQDWASSPEGTRTIVNIMNRNRGALGLQ